MFLHQLILDAHKNKIKESTAMLTALYIGCTSCTVARAVLLAQCKYDQHLSLAR